MTDMGAPRSMRSADHASLCSAWPLGRSMLIWSGLAITQEGELRFWYVALIVLCLVIGVINLLLFRKNAADNLTRS